MTAQLKLSIEIPENETRVAVARRKPCRDCGRSWDECGGGWMRFADAATLEASWQCNDCFDKEPKPPGWMTGPPILPEFEGCPKCRLDRIRMTRRVVLQKFSLEVGETWDVQQQRFQPDGSIDHVGGGRIAADEYEIIQRDHHRGSGCCPVPVEKCPWHQEFGP